MGILDTLANLSPEQSQGLLATGLGILANNTGHYGALAPALGLGGQEGLQNYQNQMRLKQQFGLQTRGMNINEAYKTMQEKLLEQEAAMKKMQIEQMGGLSDFYRGGQPAAPQTQVPQSQVPQAAPAVMPPQSGPGVSGAIGTSLAGGGGVVGGGAGYGATGSMAPGAAGAYQPPPISPIGAGSGSGGGAGGSGAPQTPQVTPAINVTASSPSPSSKIGEADYWLNRAQQADAYMRRNGYNPLIQKERDDALKQVNEIRQRFMSGIKDINGNIVSVDPDKLGTTTLGHYPKQPEAWMQTDAAGNITGINPLYKEYEIQKAEAGAAKTQVQVNAQLPASEAAQKDFMDKTAKNYDVLRNAPSDLQNLQEAKKLVAQAGPFVGSFADKKLDIAKFFNNNFGTNIAAENVASAEELGSRLFQQILGNLKKLDAQPSEQQQAIMQKAMGNLTTDPGALPRVIGVMEQIIRNKVELHNKEVQSGISRGVKFPYDPIIKIPPLLEGGFNELSGTKTTPSKTMPSLQQTTPFGSPLKRRPDGSYDYVPSR